MFDIDKIRFCWVDPKHSPEGDYFAIDWIKILTEDSGL
jgi:hypothetical protein